MIINLFKELLQYRLFEIYLYTLLPAAALAGFLTARIQRAASITYDYVSIFLRAAYLVTTFLAMTVLWPIFIPVYIGHEVDFKRR